MAREVQQIVKEQEAFFKGLLHEAMPAMIAMMLLE